LCCFYVFAFVVNKDVAYIKDSKIAIRYQTTLENKSTFRPKTVNEAKLLNGWMKFTENVKLFCNRQTTTMPHIVTVQENSYSPSGHTIINKNIARQTVKIVPARRRIAGRRDDRYRRLNDAERRTCDVRTVNADDAETLHHFRC